MIVPQTIPSRLSSNVNANPYPVDSVAQGTYYCHLISEVISGTLQFVVDRILMVAELLYDLFRCLIYEPLAVILNASITILKGTLNLFIAGINLLAHRILGFNAIRYYDWNYSFDETAYHFYLITKYAGAAFHQAIDIVCPKDERPKVERDGESNHSPNPRKTPVRNKRLQSQATQTTRSKTNRTKTKSKKTEKIEQEEKIEKKRNNHLSSPRVTRKLIFKTPKSNHVKKEKVPNTLGSTHSSRQKTREKTQNKNRSHSAVCTPTPTKPVTGYTNKMGCKKKHLSEPNSPGGDIKLTTIRSIF